MTVTILDYGVGNLRSLINAFEACGTTAVVADPHLAIGAEWLVLPGVGAFDTSAARLADYRAPLRARISAGAPTLGICLGMQLLFDGSDEGMLPGIGAVAGRVSRLDARRVPQLGWNGIDEARDPLFTDSAITCAYYANAYACRPSDPSVVVAWSRHDNDRFPAAIRVANTVGVQFHPEKSSAAGLRFLAAWLRGSAPAPDRSAGATR